MAENISSQPLSPDAAAQKAIKEKRKALLGLGPGNNFVDRPLPVILHLNFTLLHLSDSDDGAIFFFLDDPNFFLCRNYLL